MSIIWAGIYNDCKNMEIHY